jgi:hypothetical protein
MNKEIIQTTNIIRDIMKSSTIDTSEKLLMSVLYQLEVESVSIVAGYFLHETDNYLLMALLDDDDLNKDDLKLEDYDLRIINKDTILSLVPLTQVDIEEIQNGNFEVKGSQPHNAMFG